MDNAQVETQRLLGQLLERSQSQQGQLEVILQNGVARDEAMRHLGDTQRNRLEEVQHEIVETLAQKVRDGVHEQANATTAIIGRLEERLNEVGLGVKELATRVDQLEEPMRRALSIRLRRRALWVKITSVASIIGVGSWAIMDPLWKALAEPAGRYLARKLFGMDAP